MLSKDRLSLSIVFAMPVLGMLSGWVCKMPDTESLAGRPPGWVFGVVWPVLYTLMGLVGRSVFLKQNPLEMWLWGTVMASTLAWPAVVSCDSKRGRWVAGMLLIAVNLIVGTMLLVSMVQHGHGAVVLAIVPFLAWNSFAALLNWQLIREGARRGSP